MNNKTHYTPAMDITKKKDDGSVEVIARKGVPIPLAEAIRLGLIKAPQTQGPSERKA